MRHPGTSLRIVVLAHSRHPLREPHAGGLEASVWERVRDLRARGHRVLLCGPGGSDFLSERAEHADLMLPSPTWPDAGTVNDTAYPAGYLRDVQQAMERALRRVASWRGRIDVVDNHSLHPTPLLWADRLGTPMLTTLHTPPLPELLEARGAMLDPRHRFVAVSTYTAAAWAAAGVSSSVLPNAVDITQWPLGQGGTGLVWFGRLVPEKAPHLAIAAARVAGRPLVLAGRIGDTAYFDAQIRPRLGPDVRYVGPLRRPELAELVGGSAVALVTPVWDEPFGMVIVEAMATGTPVAAFEAGGVREVAGHHPGAIVVPTGDVRQLGSAIHTLRARTAADPGLRRSIRQEAARRHSLGRRHDQVETIFREMAARPAVVGAGWSAHEGDVQRASGQ